jgi:hypothetical protein
VSRTLPFPTRDTEAIESPREPERRQTRQQIFVEFANQAFESVGAESPPAGLLGLWLRKIFAGDAEGMLLVLEELALLGALNRGPGYLYARLCSAVNSDDLNPYTLLRRRLKIGSLNIDRSARWTGLKWQSIGPAGDGE